MSQLKKTKTKIQMKKLFFIVCFIISASVVNGQNLKLNGEPINSDTIYIKKGSFNHVTFNVPLPTRGVLVYQWLMNNLEYAGGPGGLVYINEKGRYRGRIIWYHDGTAEIYFSTKLYVKYGKPVL